MMTVALFAGSVIMLTGPTAIVCGGLCYKKKTDGFSSGVEDES